jgi:hypothetical protein
MSNDHGRAADIAGDIVGGRAEKRKFGREFGVKGCVHICVKVERGEAQDVLRIGIHLAPAQRPWQCPGRSIRVAADLIGDDCCDVADYADRQCEEDCRIARKGVEVFGRDAKLPHFRPGTRRG